MRTKEAVKVFIQTPDGRVVEVSNAVMSLSIDHDHAFNRCTHIELDAEGTVQWMTTELFRRTLQIRRTAREFRCTWCSQPTNASRKYCIHCGGKQGFLIGDTQ